MTRSEALTTYAALAVGRAIWHSQAQVSANLLGAMLTSEGTEPMATTVLKAALGHADKTVTDTTHEPFTVSEFYTEVRRITRSTPDDDITVRAMKESGTTIGFIGSEAIAPGKGN